MNENIKDGYFEVPLPETGVAYCSDNQCDCGFLGVTIPQGHGYVYISQECVDFRKDARTIEACKRKIDKISDGGNVVFKPGMAVPILCCERAACKRRLNLEIAAADAKYWWENQLVPLRATPKQIEDLKESNININIKASGISTTIKNIKGGFGEPYCSEKCYENGGKYISTVMMNNQSGACGYCKKQVHATMYGKLECAVIPFEGNTLFICLNCVDKAKECLQKYNKCSICGKNLYENVNIGLSATNFPNSRVEESVSKPISLLSGSFHEIGILFDIFTLGSGSYGYGHEAFKVFFDAIDPHKIPISTIYHGDISLKNRGTDVYCIAVQSFEKARINYIKDIILRRNDNGLLPVEQRLIEDNFIKQCPLVIAGRVDLNGKFIVPKNSMIFQDWVDGTVWNISVQE